MANGGRPATPPPTAQLDPRIRLFSIFQGFLLAQLIDAANPYRAVRPKSWDNVKDPIGGDLQTFPSPTIKYETVDNVLVEEKTTPSTAKHAYDLLLNESLIQNELGEWKFKGVPNMIERGLRVAYRYYKPVFNDDEKGTAVLVKAYFIIGYENGGGY